MSAGVHAREDVSFRDVKIKIPDRTCGCEWRYAPEACAEDFGGSEKKSVSWVPGSEEEGWLPHTRRGLAAGVTRVGGCRWKSQVYLSPYVEKPFNSKVIKSFVPELRSRKCFSCFVIPMFYVYELWTLYVRFTYTYLGILHSVESILFYQYCFIDTVS